MTEATQAAVVDVVSPAQQEGTKAALKVWLKAVGDQVEEGEPLVELETDKVALEVPAPASGRLASILVHDGSVEPGDLLGRIEPTEAAVNAAEAFSPSSTSNDAPSAHHRASGRDRHAPLTKFDPELRLSPSVRRLLMESDIDPAALTGTGKNGRITREDVLAEISRRKTDVQPAGPSPALSSSPSPAVSRHIPTPAPADATLISRRVPHDTMRRRIADHMTRSVATAPHVTAIFEADFSAIMAHRRARKAEFEAQDINLTLTAYIVQACVEAMKAAPSVNSRWHDDAVEIFSSVNIGIGTALGDKGLVVPVIHNAEGLSLLGIAMRLQDMTARARNGKLTLDDVKNGTFTISNHGVSGSLLAAPIVINQPQSAILGVGKIEKRVIVRETGGVDTIQIRPMSYVSLTIDHRVIDGTQANAWLTRFVETVENWPND